MHNMDATVVLVEQMEMKPSYDLNPDCKVEIKQERELLEISPEDIRGLNTEIDLGNVVVKSEDFGENDDGQEVPRHVFVRCNENAFKHWVTENEGDVHALSEEILVLDFELLDKFKKEDKAPQKDMAQQKLFEQSEEAERALQNDITKLKQIIKSKSTKEMKLRKTLDKRHDSSSRGKILKCNHCDYTTNLRNTLNRHVVVHEKLNAKVYYCQRCSFKTLHAHNLGRHFRLHEEKVPYNCLNCTKSFNDKTALDAHLLNHHDSLRHLITSKIHYCQFCTYKTIVATSLVRHIAYRHDRKGARKFRCRKCDYFGLQKRDLHRHLRVHSDSRPFMCTACKSRFNRKFCLDIHIIKSHMEDEDLVKTITNEIHDCAFCGYKTGNKRTLYQHVTKKHKQSSA